MHAGERHFGSADQVLVVGLAQTVDLVGVGVRKPVPRMTSGRTSVGVMASVNAVLLGLVHGHGEHGDLHTGHLAHAGNRSGSRPTLTPRRMSMPATPVPRVRWSLGSKPSAAKSRIWPTFLTTT